jgi:hypothetical protein
MCGYHVYFIVCTRHATLENQHFAQTTLFAMENIFVVGWGWNCGQSSPTSSKDFKKLVVIRMAGAGAGAAAAASAATGTGHVYGKADSPTGKKRRHAL